MTTQNPYLLLTPGPLSTTPAVREAMLRDWCTWDADYNNLVEGMRADLVALAIPDEAKRAEYTAVPMQGSGTYGVESVIGSVIPDDGRILVLANGAYGHRAAQIARTLRNKHRRALIPRDRAPRRYGGGGIPRRKPRRDARPHDPLRDDDRHTQRHRKRRA